MYIVFLDYLYSFNDYWSSFLVILVIPYYFIRESSSVLISDIVSDPYGPLNFLEDIFWEYILVLGGESSDLGSQQASMIFSRFSFSLPLSPSSSSKKNERAVSVIIGSLI